MSKPQETNTERINRLKEWVSIYRVNMRDYGLSDRLHVSYKGAPLYVRDIDTLIERLENE